MRASRSPRRSLGNFAVDMALRDMRRKPDPLITDLVNALKSYVSHSEAWEALQPLSRESQQRLDNARAVIARAEGK